LIGSRGFPAVLELARNLSELVNQAKELISFTIVQIPEFRFEDIWFRLLYNQEEIHEIFV